MDMFELEDGFGDLEAMDFEDFGGEGLEGEEFDGYDAEAFDGEDFDFLDGFDGLDGLDGESPAAGRGAAVDAETASMLMDMYADMAAEAESDSEADAFLPLLGALAPMAIKALAPVAMGAAKRVLPVVAKGVVSAGRKLLQSNVGRQTLRALPNIAKGVARDTLQRVASGQPVSPQTVARSAARQTLPYLRDPRRRRHAMRRCHYHAMQMRRRLGTPSAQSVYRAR